MNCKNCARLAAELAVRTSGPDFPSRPERFRKRGVSSAFDTGYEAGWRGRDQHNSYTRSDCWDAYNAGYAQGKTESDDEISRTLREQSA